MEQNLQTDDKDRQEYPLTDIVKLDATLNEILQKVPSTAEILGSIIALPSKEKPAIAED